jgi:hypothetical protein
MWRAGQDVRGDKANASEPYKCREAIDGEPVEALPKAGVDHRVKGRTPFKAFWRGRDRATNDSGNVDAVAGVAVLDEAVKILGDDIPVAHRHEYPALAEETTHTDYGGFIGVDGEGHIPCVHVHGFCFHWVTNRKEATGSASTAALSGRAQRSRIFLDTPARHALGFMQPGVHAGPFSFDRHCQSSANAMAGLATAALVNLDRRATLIE